MGLNPGYLLKSFLLYTHIWEFEVAYSETKKPNQKNSKVEYLMKISKIVTTTVKDLLHLIEMNYCEGDKNIIATFTISTKY